MPAPASSRRRCWRPAAPPRRTAPTPPPRRPLPRRRRRHAALRRHRPRPAGRPAARHRHHAGGLVHLGRRRCAPAAVQVVAVDRPGSGHSSRPGGATWTPERQAAAIAELLRRLGAEDAVVVGHSFGALPALALALHSPRAVYSLVLVAGTLAPGAPLIERAGRVPTVPILSGIARATITPSAARAAAPLWYAMFFEPQPVPRAFVERYPLALACRPSQLKASAEDAEMTDAAVERLVPAAAALGCPIAVVTGSGDAVLDPDVHARPFAALTGAALAVVPAGGHMVHHSFPAAVAGVIRDAAEDRLPTAAKGAGDAGNDGDGGEEAPAGRYGATNGPPTRSHTASPAAGGLSGEGAPAPAGRTPAGSSSQPARAGKRPGKHRPG